MKTWKRRWFILTDNCLYYFEYTTVSGLCSGCGGAGHQIQPVWHPPGTASQCGAALWGAGDSRSLEGSRRAKQHCLCSKVLGRGHLGSIQPCLKAHK